MKTKYIYNVTEQTVDLRNFTIETDTPLQGDNDIHLSLIHISEPTRPY